MTKYFQIPFLGLVFQKNSFETNLYFGAKNTFLTIFQNEINSSGGYFLKIFCD